VGETLLDEARAQLRAAKGITEVFAIVRTAARTVAGADGATVVLREGDNCFYADEDAMSPLWKGQRFPLDDCISGWAMRNDEIAVIPDIRLDTRIPQAAYRPTFVRSLAMVPIGARVPVGAIGAYWAHVRTATDEEIANVRALAAAAAHAIARVGLAEAPFTPSAMTDQRDA